MALKKTNLPDKKLMIVDDDSSALKVLSGIFTKYYSVETAASGEEAYEKLKKGYKPGVILCDQRMPGMNGSELLEKSIVIVPDAIRIIITGYSNPKDIITAINQAHAYMYLTKPAKEIDLIQAVRNGFNYYTAHKKNKDLIKQLNQSIHEIKQKNSELEKIRTDYEGSLPQIIQSLSALMNISERFYYNNHTQYVAGIAKSIADEIGLTPEQKSLLLMSAHIHTVPRVALPVKFQLSDPYDLSEKERFRYFELYDKAVINLGKIKLLKNHAMILAQLWEHYDGSGYSKGLSGKDIDILAQIIAIAVIYHNNVYRIRPDELPKLQSNGYIEQNFEETFMRHREAVKMLYRRSGWFDIDVSNTFHDLAKKKMCDELIPVKATLKLNCSENSDTPIHKITESEPLKEKSKEADTVTGSDQISVSSKPDEVQLTEKDIPIDELTPGMIVGQNVVTKKGMLIIRQDNKLEPAIVKNIKQLAENGMLDNYVTIMVPKE